MEKNCCKNCKYFIQHYSYTKSFRLNALGCWHCIKGERKCSPIYVCDKFIKERNEFVKQKEIEMLGILHNINLYFKLLDKINKKFKP